MIAIALVLLAGLVRVLGVILRRTDLPTILNVAGQFIRPLAMWLVLVAANAWPPVWPVLLLGLFSVVFSREDEEWLLPAIIDLLTVVSSALLSLPPLETNQIVVLAVLLPLSAFTLDWTTENLLAQERVRRLYRNSAVLILLTGLPVAGLLLFNPGALRNGVKLLSGRFEYLIPIDNSTEPPYIPSLGDHVIVVDSDDGRGLSLVEGTQWAPYLEWQLSNPSVTGNPYDLVATVTFVHPDSGEQHTTPMFYNGGEAWHFRFTATLPGDWHYTTQSDDPDLDGYEGQVDIEANPGVAGFVTNYGNKWGRTGLNEAFIPQFVMISGPQGYYNNDQEIELLIQTFFDEHGFNGVHTPVFCRWFDINQPDCDKINAAGPNPDPQTFEALEALITRVHAAGGVVHIWMWGDDARSQNPKRWGINGTVDQRLQRYIAARLGPLPGWTMGYGFDLHEWVNGKQLTVWHDYMHAHFGWPHYLGARASKNQLNQLSEAMDYSAYEQHKPDYEKYVETIEARPNKPSFSEDRFRIRDEGNAKDYNIAETRRGLWHSAMAGGIANIWGNLLGAASGANEGETSSAPYPRPEWIQTYSRFFEDRFTQDLVRCNELTDGVCLMRPTQQHFLFYTENTDSLQLDLSDMDQSQPVIAVDTLLPYQEIVIGSLSPTDQSWSAPYTSDWAIAIGDFGNSSVVLDQKVFLPMIES